MTTDLDAKIVDKIQKLLALAGNNPNKEEAQTALNMAHKLLEGHNISLLEVEQSGAKRDTDRRADDRHSGALYKWQMQVWEETAKLNFCAYFRIRGLSKGAKYEHRIVGSPVNSLATKLMAEYLQGAIERVAREWAKAKGLNIFTKDAVVFREGMAAEICGRLANSRWDREQEARRQAAENTGNSTAVTIFGVKTRESDLNNDYIYGWAPGTTASHRAEREAHYAAWTRSKKEQEAAHLRRLETDPAYRAEFEAEQEISRKIDEAREKEFARKARAREKYYEKHGYRSRGNEQTRRRDNPAFYEGYRAAKEIGLDQQVDHNNTSRKELK